ncbi:MAG: zinc-finger domain-containing protein [Gemmatimonadaceae bacterium]|nr:zinc-finger domain-containing protein [Acetobacteraceae bacterium]
MPFGANMPLPDVGSPEVFYVDDRVVACDGGDGGGGHPRVWLRIEQRQTFCPWCSRIFVLNDGAGDSDH